MEHSAASELEKDLIYLGLLDKAHEIYAELGARAVLSYIKSSYRLLSKVYHPDMNPASTPKAVITQQALNRVNSTISRMTDEELLDVIERGLPRKDPGRKLILIVEDEPEMQQIIQKILMMEGYDSVIAEDGIKGYEVYTKYEPDLMLCDVVMPRMNGLELVEKVRETNPRIKVIYVSGFFGLTPLKGRFEEEVTKYGYHTLAKPFKASEMLALVGDYLNKDMGEIPRVDTVV